MTTTTTTFSVHPYGFDGLLEVHEDYVLLRSKGGDKRLDSCPEVYWDTVHFLQRATGAQLQTYVDNIIDYGENV